jgi:phosphate transport system permease protein
MSTISALRRSLDGRSSEGIDRSALVAGAIGGACLLGAFVGFLVQSNLTAVFLIGFLLTTGYGWYAHQALAAKSLSFLATFSTLVVMGLIIVFVIREAIPAIQYMGLDLLTRTKQPFWNPSAEIYSLVPMMWGTFVTTLLAIAVAAPLGITGALFISEVAPGWLREIVKPGIEILAGIPTIVYGFIGFTILNPYLDEVLELSTFGSLFAGGLMIGVIALPTVVSIAEDALSSVPESMKSGSLALGSTDWQTMTGVTVPAAFSGISAAVLLGVGRAVGETMAVTVMLANVTELPDPLYDIFGSTITLTSAIASQYGNASGLQLSALFAAGVVLFTTVMTLSVGSQVIERRMRQKLGGKR